MKIKITEKARVICQNRTSLHNYFGWPTVARLGNGTLIMVSSGFRARHVCPFGKVAACLSFDEGKTWTRPAVLIDTPLDDRDAGVMVSGERVMVTSFNNKAAQQIEWSRVSPASQYFPGEERPCLYSKKDLHGCTREYILEYLNSIDTEAAERDFYGSTYIISEDGGITFGDIKRIPVTAPHGPAAGNDGRFIYVGVKLGGTLDCENNILCFCEGEDGEFQLTGSIENIEAIGGNAVEGCEPHALCLPDGKILVHIRVHNRDDGRREHTSIFTLYQSESCDGGKTFTKPHPISDDMALGAPAHLLRLKDGRIISVFGFRSEPYGVKAIISCDEGRSWSEPFMLYNNGSIALDIGYPASCELSDGRILTVFYARPEKGAPSEIMQVIWEIDGE